MPKNKGLLLFILLIILGTIIFHIPQSIHGEDRVVTELSATADDLRSAIYEKRRVLLVYGDHDDYKNAVEKTVKQSRWVTIEPRTAESVTEEELQNEILILIGTPTANPLLAAFLEHLPVRFIPSAFFFQEEEFTGESDVLTMIYPNPYQSSLPLQIITGNSDTAISSALKASRNLFRPSGDYNVSRDGKLAMMGFFEVTVDGWVPDKTRQRDFRQGAATSVRNGDITLYQHGMALTLDSLHVLGKHCEEVLRQVAAFTGKPTGEINLHLYATAERKGLMTHNTQLFHLGRSSEKAAHLVHRRGLTAADGVAEATLALSAAMGKPRFSALLDGLALNFSKGWGNGRGVGYWAQRLHDAGMMPELSELVNETLYQKSSPLVMPVAVFSFVAFLRAEKGDSWLKKNFVTWLPSADEQLALQRQWKSYLNSQSSHDKKIASPIKAAGADLNSFHRGFCFAHEGYSIYNGYGSQLADDALAAMASLQSNATSITPFSYMRNPQKPSFLEYSDRAGSETDESVIHSAMEAQRLGMSVMLKPHIWLGRGSWPGAIEMQNEEDWQRFFQHYRRWMRHFALMAEMYEMEMLCIGVELGKTTLQRPQDWQRLIAELRLLYRGKMVYAANWGEEFEQLTFWSNLDYIGLNSYYPLSEDPAASDAALEAGMRVVLEKIKRIGKQYDRPILLTEIGFTATRSSWLQPHEVARGKELAPEDQRRAYAAVFNALGDNPAIAGMYWWKWPTYLSYGGLRDNDFTPNAKPAEQEVRSYYRKFVR